mgnify:CR=1 FL=1
MSVGANGQVSARSGEGMDKWLAWLEAQMELAVVREVNVAQIQPA